jgi:glycosyltransferase involved in cell wall biosynthesis
VDVLWSLGYTAPLHSPCPQVVTIHDMQYKTYPEDLAPHYRLATDMLVKAAARRSARVIAISEFAKSEIVRFTAAPPDRIDVTHLAADSAYAEPLSAERRRAVMDRLPPVGEHYILCVANTYPHKNVDALVEAFRRLSGVVPHRLVIVGSPRLGERKFQAALAELPDAGRAIRLEKMNTGQLVALYQGADLFVLPSLYEGFGLPVLEAMMAGAPVVTTRRASIPEVGGDEVVYFDPDSRDDLAQKIREVLRWPPERRAERTARARQRARSFSWRRTADQTVSILKRALETVR